MTYAIEAHTYPALNAPVRVVTIDGQPWFPAKDVCELLEISSGRQAVRAACWPEDYQHVKHSNVCSTSVSFPNRGMLCVNESGLHALIFNSRKPEAREFKHWVTSVVLPAIRKDGMYVMGEEKVVTGEKSMEELAGDVMKYFADKVARQKAEIAAVSEERDVAKQVQAIAVSQIAAPTRTLHKIARTLEGVNTMAIKRDLMNAGYLYRKAGQYRVYAKFQHLFQEKIDEQYGRAEITCTEAGVMEVQELYRKGALTMKALRRA